MTNLNLSPSGKRILLAFPAQGQAETLTTELSQMAFEEIAFWGLLRLFGSAVPHPLTHLSSL